MINLDEEPRTLGAAIVYSLASFTVTLAGISLLVLAFGGGT